MNSPNTQNRRNFTRVTFDGATLIRQGDQQWPVTLVDLSLKGLLIEKLSHWNADTNEAMEADIQIGEDITVTMQIAWRHTENEQMGFECNLIDLDSIVHLRRLVELNVGDANLLERELSALGS